MPDLNDFYAFKMTPSDNGYSGRNKNTNNHNNGDSGCSTILIGLAIIGWIIWFIGEFFA